MGSRLGAILARTAERWRRDPIGRQRHGRPVDGGVQPGQPSFEPIEALFERVIARSRLEREHRLLRRGPSDRVHDPSRGHDASRRS
jgi:hypothetical protein